MLSYTLLIAPNQPSMKTLNPKNRECHIILLFLILLTSNLTYSQYCPSTGKASEDIGITSVSFNAINNTSATNLAYTDYTLSESTTVMQGYSHSLTVNLNTDGNRTVYSMVWIDWNQNNLFDDGVYDMGTATNVTDGSTTLSGLSVSIPMGATLGTTRMRVSSKDKVDLDSCDTDMKGEVEDYSIVVIAYIPLPEINIKANGISIVNGDIIPSTLDDTDYGATNTGTPIIKTFTIENLGFADLNISNITLSNSSDFSITGTPYSSSVSASGNTAFDITYNATSGGSQTTTVTINNDDSDEGSYQFDITAESECPIVNLTGSSSTPESCLGCNDVSITFGTASGGTPPYEYSVDGVNWSASTTFSDLWQEYFTLYVRDSYGCIGEERISNSMSFTAGACVIDMGITPQTVNNGLAPYGLIYDLVENYNIPIYWIIDNNKTFVSSSTIVNEKDLTITGTTTRLGSTPITTDLKAGPFLIPAEYINDAYAAIESWQTSKPGLTVHWNLNAITNAPVHGIIKTLANVVIYPLNGNVNDETDIEDAFFIPSGIPSTAYRRGPISDLNGCDEIYVLSHHTDPDVNWSQADIDAIYNYVVNGGNVWMGCHDVSITESLLTTSDGKQLNFLSNSGLIPYKSINDISTDYPYLNSHAIGDEIKAHDGNFDTNSVLYDINSAGNPMMQFMEEIHDAQDGNSEHVYVPFIDGWRTTTTTPIYDPTHGDLPAGNNRTPGEAALVAYGPAFGNSLYGTILYQASHINAKNNGSDSEYVGDRRVFGNYLLESAIRYTKDAGSDQTFLAPTCGDVSTTLDASKPINSAGVWSIESGTGGSFSDVTNPKSEFYGQENETYDLKWSINCDEDNVEVTFVTQCSTIDFDGIDDNITFNDNYDLSSNFSIELWMKPEASNNNIQTIFSKRDARNLSTGYDLRLVNNTLSFNWNDSGSIASPYTINTNRWYHVAVAYSSGTYKLYIDGVEVNSSAGVIPTNTADTVDFLLGAMDQVTTSPFKPVNHYNGWMDELRIWSVGLTANQVRSMMNQEIENNGGNVKGSTIPLDINNLSWTNLDGYYQMNQSTDIVSGNLQPICGATQGRLRNSDTYQAETAPLPYTSGKDGNWTTIGTSSPWTHCTGVWSSPNSIGIDGTTDVDWNIIKISHNITIDTKNVTVLGLLQDSSTNLTVTNSGTQDETNPGHSLRITNYLQLNGFIDLVGESQLLQDEGSVLALNSSGTLERDQQGTRDFYTYNYWSSPVGISNTVSNNNNYTLPDVLNDGSISASPMAITFLSSGYNGTPGTPGTTAVGIADYWIWKYANKTSDTYSQWQHVRSTGNLLAGEGFTMKGVHNSGTSFGERQNYTFNGKPNNGDISLTLSAGNSYLIGNPYPSAIDANEFILDNISDGAGRAASNIFDGTLYFWDHFAGNTHVLREYQGGYATYTLMGGIIAVSTDTRIDASGVEGTKIPKQYIPVSQGFFVTADAGGNVTFKNSQRIFKTEASDPSLFLKGDNKKNKSSVTIPKGDNEDPRQKIRLMFDSPKGYHRQILVGIDKNATNGIEKGYDALLTEKNAEDMFWVFKENNFVIQAVNNFDENQMLPIGIKTKIEGISTIKIDGLENITSDVDIYLHDKELNIYKDLKDNDYEVFLDAGEYLNRFEITFSNPQTLNTNEVPNNIEVNVYFSNEKESIIIHNPSFKLIESVEMFNILGQSLFRFSTNTTENYIEYNAKQIKTGTYILKINSEYGNISKKVLIE